MSKMVSASDLEKYAYCPLSWWLSQQQQDRSAPEKTGTEKHIEAETRINEIALKERETRNLERIILLFSFIATMISIFGMVLWLPDSKIMSEILLTEALLWLIFSLYFLRYLEKSKNKSKVVERLIILTAIGSIVVAIYSLGFVFPENSVMGMVMQVSALVWLMAATTILWRDVSLEQQVRKERKKMEIPEGEIVYVDLDDGKTEILQSERYGLRGRPDHIIEKEGQYIPVELKTGRTPRGPLFSHIVQIGVYGLIIEDITGKRPPYGILKYPEKSFEIDFTDELRDIILRKRDELLMDLERGIAHRNHRRAGKCRACSRRKICPEKLE